ncbi:MULTISPECIES: 4-alpha-glucanotransferase [Rhodococcus]|uniref:4-alpha-glucanotransferase n=1 Tax=Rhodococcus TaxID=1827 RepID=UPI0002A36316|nr:4-alpha-glucanotransferase [Rhodococcus opacus]ELB94630.1 4-alpha-glucanotransferase [Rhodococcus wratislaviensis IFP 2016]NHU44590.1 4-alpha-glucanotransferase [Rhodococcus sp. A14]MDJ0413769.1 4-alpha-glucanotransferase [Rhodococcus opacus]MDV6242632.1 4-alpha-glucanotransferase [Rhodococcus opacus]QZS54159.1 4-alpha-glucanotransferase [Rhodococcus opacus]
MTYTEQLRDLAARHGVATSYRGWDQQRHDVRDDTLRSVLSALDIPAGTEEEVRHALSECDVAPWRRMLPPVVVGREGFETRFMVHVPHGEAVDVTIDTESGGTVPARQLQVWVDPRQVDGALVGRATFVVPADVPCGWHTVRASTSHTSSSCTLVVTPARLSTSDALRDRRRWGVLTQLYSIRSRRSWGVGDFGDLADLASIFGSVHGADYVLVNPLHAAQPRPPIEASPYLPTTRRYVNPMYIRVENIPETAYLSTRRHARMRDAAARFERANDRSDRIDRNPSYRAKLRVLERVFRIERSPSRQHAFEQFCRDEGDGLRDFATWCALTEKLSPDDPRWTTKAGAPDSDWVQAQRRKLAPRIEFYSWLQWVCDEQLSDAQDAARAAGMDIGIVHDLAVGVQRGGADAWSLGTALAEGITVGAPPDDFNQQGQQWNQPPWRPDRLAELGYAPYRDMLRTVLKHAGGLRVDHILGLFRLWWIPADAESPADGTYVSYDHEALVGILALEAERAGAVVIGEDLGVFEPAVQDYLAERGILGTSILWFEHDGERPTPPEQYRTLCLTSVTTHDLPPTAGYLAGEHIELRSRLGLLERDLELEKEHDARQREAVLQLARDRGLLAADASIPDTVKALYRLIDRSPSLLTGVALADLVGEYRVQNQPGTDETQYSNWKIPLADASGRAVHLEDLADGDFGFVDDAR